MPVQMDHSSPSRITAPLRALVAANEAVSEIKARARDRRMRRRSEKRAARKKKRLAICSSGGAGAATESREESVVAVVLGGEEDIEGQRLWLPQNQNQMRSVTGCLKKRSMIDDPRGGDGKSFEAYQVLIRSLPLRMSTDLPRTTSL